mgnify:FL=1
MDNNIAKEKIINGLKHISTDKYNVSTAYSDVDADIFCKPDEDLEVEFAKNFTENGGKLIFCETDNDLIESVVQAIERFGWNDIYCDNPSVVSILHAAGVHYKSNIGNLTSVKYSMTTCDALIAKNGCIVISSDSDVKGKLSTISKTHIVFANIGQIVPDIKAAFTRMKAKGKNKLPENINIISCPSVTTAIENKINVGAQGADSLYLFLLA